MDRGVIKFHTLADADRAGAQHQNRRLVGDDAFVFLLVGGIEVRDVGAELPGTGVDHLVDRPHIVLAAPLHHFQLAPAQDFAQIFIGEA